MPKKLLPETTDCRSAATAGGVHTSMSALPSSATTVAVQVNVLSQAGVQQSARSWGELTVSVSAWLAIIIAHGCDASASAVRTTGVANAPVWAMSRSRASVRFIRSIPEPSLIGFPNNANGVPGGGRW